MARLMEHERPEFDPAGEEESIYQLIWILNSRLNELDNVIED